MTSERSSAYRCVLNTLADVGPSKLLAAEQDRIRNAADELIFSRDPDDLMTIAALCDIDNLCAALVESGRWEQGSATRLAEAIAACGPARMPLAQAA